MTTIIEQPLSEFINIGSRFLRSVNLEKDYLGAQRNGDYILTPTARQVISRVAESLRNNSPHRAWTITGPYGVGKSAFAVYLTRLICPTGESTAEARRQLQATDTALAVRLLQLKVFEKPRKGFFPIPVTARRAATSPCILEGLLNAASRAREHPFHTCAKKLKPLAREANRSQSLDSSAVVNALADVNSAAIKSGYSGVLLLVDELGKLFEFAARSPHKADIFLLQQIAEYASRSSDTPVLLVGLLHQSFEDYGQHLDSVSRKEWAKVQGRYEDIPFLEPADQVIRMVAKAIRWKSKVPQESVHSKIVATVKIAAGCGAIPSGIRQDEFEATAAAAYPLHPCALVALPFLFRRFAQNERSLFSYLSSLEPFGFQDFLRNHALDPSRPPFVRLSDLFDYFTENFGSGLFRQPHARRWMEAADILDRKNTLTDDHVALVKTIGILNALGEFSPLNAREPIIRYALADTLSQTSALTATLQDLKSKSLVTYRNFNDTYRIWEGSDVDLDEKIAEGTRNTRDALSLSATLATYLPPRPFVARRHSAETGALRFFSVHYADSAEILHSIAATQPEADGRIIVCLSASAAQTQEFGAVAKNPTTNAKDVVFAIPQDIGEIRAATSELAALRWVWDKTPELRDDRAARRELASRIADAEQLLKTNLHRLLDPRESPVGSRCLWFYGGDQWPTATPVDVSKLLSKVCDKLYCDGPRIRNELVVRRSLSSAAAAARRNLIEAMLTKAAQPTLAIEGYPPERSMYESVLHATGLHSRTPEGQFRFSPPAKKHPSNLWPAWQRLSEFVFAPQTSPKRLDQVFDELAAPPYGVADGLHPILLTAFLAVHADEVTLYREGTFIPAPGVADLETILRRPELFAIAGTRVQGARADVVARLAKGLNVAPATVPVVRALFAMVRSLPELAWSTNRLPEEAKSLRQAFDNAKSPDKFLFTELPQAIGIDPIPDEKLGPAAVESIFAKLNQILNALRDVTPATLRRSQDELLQACGLPPQPQGWQALREAAIRLEPFANKPELRAFLIRARQSAADQAGVASVIELVANAPLNTWTDIDIDAFPGHAKAIGILFAEADALQARHAQRAMISQLTPDQRRQAQKIQKQLQEYLAPALKSNSRESVYAALMSYAQQLQEGHD